MTKSICEYCKYFYTLEVMCIASSGVLSCSFNNTLVTLANEEWLKEGEKCK